MRGIAAILFLVLMVSGCSAKNFAPVVDIYGQDARQRKVTSGTHHVREGETLYSIAWRYGWDYRELAKANRIPAPYTIYPGQRISLALASSSATAPVTSSKPSSQTSKPALGCQPSPAVKPAPKPSSTATCRLHHQWLARLPGAGQPAAVSSSGFPMPAPVERALPFQDAITVRWLPPPMGVLFTGAVA